MGCNIGIVIARHPTVQKLVLISPELIDATKEEKRVTNQIAQEKYSHELSFAGSSNASVIEKLRLMKLFLKSKKWTLEGLGQIDILTLIVYSEGGPFVSRVGIEFLLEELNGEKNYGRNRLS